MLWKALITLVSSQEANRQEARRARAVIEDLLIEDGGLTLAKAASSS